MFILIFFEILLTCEIFKFGNCLDQGSLTSLSRSGGPHGLNGIGEHFVSENSYTTSWSYSLTNKMKRPYPKEQGTFL